MTEGAASTLTIGDLFANLSIFNPPILERKNTDRTGEVIGIKVIRFLNQFGLFASQKSMPTEILAKALVNSARVSENGVHIYKGEAIWKCAEDHIPESE